MIYAIKEWIGLMKSIRIDLLDDYSIFIPLMFGHFCMFCVGLGFLIHELCTKASVAVIVAYACMMSSVIILPILIVVVITLFAIFCLPFFIIRK